MGCRRCVLTGLNLIAHFGRVRVRMMMCYFLLPWVWILQELPHVLHVKYRRNVTSAGHPRKYRQALWRPFLMIKYFLPWATRKRRRSPPPRFPRVALDRFI